MLGLPKRSYGRRSSPTGSLSRTPKRLISRKSGAVKRGVFKSDSGASTLLSSFFMVTRSRDFNEWPVGAMKYKQMWILVSW